MPSALKLNPLHAQAYDFILKFKIDHDGLAPTVSEIGKACGINSTSKVWRYLNSLVLFGMIEYEFGKGKSRTISIPGARWKPPFNAESLFPINRADRAPSFSFLPE